LHELIRFANRNGPEVQGIEQTENGAVRTDTDSQCQDRDRGIRWLPSDCAKSDKQSLHAIGSGILIASPLFLAIEEMGPLEDAGRCSESFTSFGVEQLLCTPFERRANIDE
jgi:hypothetical protein